MPRRVEARAVIQSDLKKAPKLHGDHLDNLAMVCLVLYVHFHVSHELAVAVVRSYEGQAA